ncbi:NAD-dependent epimerase/dehydratase family protein [Dictyobacter kobayashii]|uniref:3-beta hydroxysteroid dehydrogenase n=1 Tax=Dictyobacter kobayashii TaxID=2014872 RepID=A0A402AXN9_9CHLR|nr:NAD-dependent epimerase/dehydratase family protein [Dictyobacter kobayashii]GCE23858.1 3-beta hydroxysteroid dehydrogenase [Dictyobacter kobayashii]
MKILVTGGTGFLGRRLVMALLDRGHQVYMMGRNFSRVQELMHDGAIPVACDLRDHEAVSAACTGMNTVYHAAALVKPWGNWTDFFEINVDGTAAVLEGCRKHSVRRCIYVSTSSVTFGGQHQFNVAETSPYPQRFSSPYPLSKYYAEKLVNAATDVQTVILRPHTIFGPGDRWLPRLLELARQQRLYQIGNGRNRSDVTYVDNVVHALLQALYAQNTSGKTYIITNDEHVVLWSTLRVVLQRLKLPETLRTMPLPFALMLAAAMERRANWTGTTPMWTRYTATMLACTQTFDISAARRDLAYEPVVSVSEGIDRTLDSLKLHRRWTIY